MAYDGKLKFDTAIDTSGFLAGIKNIGSIAQKGLSSIGGFAQDGIQGIVSVAEKSAGLIGDSIDFTLNGIKKLGTEIFNLSKQAVKVGMSFETSMSQVMATMGAVDGMVTYEHDDGTVEVINAYEMLSEKAKELGATTKYSAAEAADALNYLALAGYDAYKACDALPTVLNLAAAGDMELARASDLVTDAISAFGYTGDFEHFADVLAKTASSSNTSVSQLGEAMLVCGGQCRTAGMDIENAATLLGILADNGIKGSEGGTALRNLMKNLYTPTQQSAKAFEELGVATEDAAHNIRPAQDVLIDIMKALEDVDGSARKMQFMSDIFDTRTIAAASAALNNSSERYDELYGKITDCNGAAAQMAKTMSDNLKGDMDILASTAQALGQTFYESVVGNLRDTVQESTDLIGQLNTAFSKDGFNGLASEAGEVIGEIIEYMFHQLPHVLKVGDEFIENLCISIKNQQGEIKYLGASIITDLIESFTQNFNRFYDIGYFISDTILSGLARKSDKISDNVSDFVSGIAETVGNNLPQMIESGTQIILAVGSGLVDALPSVMSSAEGIMTQLFSSLRKNSKDIGKTSALIISEFGSFLIKNADFLVSAGVLLLESLLEGFIGETDGISSAAEEFISSLAVTISENLPEILQLGFDILMSLINGIAENLPLIADTAVDILLMLAKFTSDNIGSLIDIAVLIITTICDELLTEENLQKLITAAIVIMKAIAEGIGENLPMLVDCASQIIGEIMRYLNDENNRREILSGAGEVVGTLIKGLIDSLDEVVDFAAMLFVELGHAIEQYDWNEIGADIANGIMSGLLGVPFDGEEFKANFADNWISGMKDILGIHSPSKLMRDEIGVYLVPGITEGIKDTSAELSDALNALIDSTFDNIDAERTFDIFADADINIPDLASKLESAVNMGNLSMLPLSAQINNVSDSDYGIEDIKNAIEQAIEDSGLDGEKKFIIYLGQERFDDMVVTAIDRYNANSGGGF